MTISFETLIDFGLGIGESPVWDTTRNVLWFVDIVAPSIHWLDPKTRKSAAYAMPSAVGSLAFTQDGRLVAALRSGIHLFDPARETLDFLVHPEPDRTTNRLNDGRIGPDGCFWVGSMHDAIPRAASGALYRITPTGSCERVIDGLKVSNGLAWSPDARTMYHADSRASSHAGEIRAFDFDARSGRLGRAKSFAVLTEKDGLPDGAAVDVNGLYWSAGVTAGCINRFSPDGVLVDSITLPVSAPTMPCFGGPDGKTVFVTSLATDRSGRAETGTVIAFRTDITGVSEPVFGHMWDDAGSCAAEPRFAREAEQ